MGGRSKVTVGNGTAGGRKAAVPELLLTKLDSQQAHAGEGSRHRISLGQHDGVSRWEVGD